MDELNRFERVFADLEARIDAEERSDRLAQVPDLMHESYADHGLVERVAGLLGTRIEVTVQGHVFTGSLVDQGEGWLALETPARLLVALRAVQLLRVPVRGRVPADLLSALSLASPLRELSRRRVPVRIALVGGLVVEGRIATVGGDYMQLRAADHHQVIPLPAVDFVQELL